MQVLDFGYVNVVESWGSDERIIEAARMSTQKGFEGWGQEEQCIKCKGTGSEPGYGPNHICRSCLGKCSRIERAGDEKLLGYLWRNNHATPFEMAGAIIEVQAPIFVFREWHRHRTQSYNEMSARYAPMPDVNYVPSIERLMLGGGHLTKQAGAIGGAAALDAESAQQFREVIQNHYEDLENTYQVALKAGVPKELARVILPVGRYSRMRASSNLRNWLGFLTLRMSPHAQWEIREYANAVHTLLSPLFPRTLALFDAGRATGEVSK